jgi:hypothetical protein
MIENLIFLNNGRILGKIKNLSRTLSSPRLFHFVNLFEIQSLKKLYCVQNYEHFYRFGEKPTGSRTCPLYIDDDKLHNQELMLATTTAQKELATHHIPFRWEPTTGINPAPVMEPTRAWGRVPIAPAPEPEPVVAPPAAAVWPLLRAPGSVTLRPAAPVAVWPIPRPPRVDEWPSLPAATGGPVAPVAPVVKRSLPAAPYRYTPRL